MCNIETKQYIILFIIKNILSILLIIENILYFFSNLIYSKTNLPNITESLSIGIKLFFRYKGISVIRTLK